jgi:hypothetical protein
MSHVCLAFAFMCPFPSCSCHVFVSGPFETKHKDGKKAYKRLQRRNDGLHIALSDKQHRVEFVEWMVSVYETVLIGILCALCLALFGACRNLLGATV